jgi:hypothetical protein
MNFFLIMTDTNSSQNIDFSSWIILYNICWKFLDWIPLAVVCKHWRCLDVMMNLLVLQVTVRSHKSLVTHTAPGNRHLTSDCAKKKKNEDSNNSVCKCRSLRAEFRINDFPVLNCLPTYDVAESMMRFPKPTLLSVFDETGWRRYDE